MNDLFKPIEFLYAGRYEAQSAATHPTRTLDHTVLLLGIRDRCEMTVAGHPYTLLPDRYLLLPADVMHGGRSPVRPGQAHFWCHFRGDVSTLPICGTLVQPERFHILFRQLLDAASGRDRTAAAICESYLRILLLELSRQEDFTPPHRLTAAALEYIRLHADRPLSPADVAAALGYSGDYLTECLRRDIGQTLTQAIHHSKGERACNLLLNTDLPIYAIAEACGFGDVKYFLRLFHRLYGLAPGAYRRNFVQIHLNHS